MVQKISPEARWRREITRMRGLLKNYEKAESQAWSAWKRAEVAQDRAYAAYQRKNTRRAKAEVALQKAEAWLGQILERKANGDG